MKVLYIPQRNDDEIIYSFEGEKITVEMEEKKGTFDFSALEEGDLYEGTENEFSTNPIINAFRKEGVLYLELLRYYKQGASDGILFPEWEVIDNE